MKEVIIFIAIVIFITSCRITKTTHSKPSLHEKNISKYNICYLEPTDWYVEKDTTYSFIINYVKRVEAKKEFSILISKSNNKDVNNIQIQEQFKRMIPGLQEQISDTIIEKGDMTFYSFTGKSNSKNVNDLHLIGFLCYLNGYEYSIILSNYFEPVMKDIELEQIFNSIKITNKDK